MRRAIERGVIPGHGMLLSAMRSPAVLIGALMAIASPPSIAGAQVIDTLEPAFAGDLVLTRVLEGLDRPTAARWLPDGRLVIIQQLGGVYVWTGTGTPSLAGMMPVVDSLGETGLLGLAVDPQFSSSNRLYFYYTAANGTTPDRHRVAWATLDPTTHQLDTAGSVEILHHLLGSGNHNGGGLEFGPDGLLYVGVGDKGCNCGCPPGTNTTNFFATCLTNASGKILRIGRDGEIPPSNPLVGTSSVTACSNNSCMGAAVPPDANVTGIPREEIYIWGLRNPWRFSFDSLTGYLWVGDVGESTWEEITVSKQAGEHHGWPFREGAHGQDISTCQIATPNTVGPCVDPVLEYHQDELPNQRAGSVVGGVFANHCSWPAPYFGRYFFGDYEKLRLWMLEPNAARDGITGERLLTVTRLNKIVDLFTGNDGAIYYVSLIDGEIWRIGPANPATCPPDAGVPPDTGVTDADPKDSGPEDTDRSDRSPIPEDAEAGATDAAPPEDAAPRDADAQAIDGGTEISKTQPGTCSCRHTRVGHPSPELGVLLVLLVLARVRFR